MMESDGMLKNLQIVFYHFSKENTSSNFWRHKGRNSNNQDTITKQNSNIKSQKSKTPFDKLSAGNKRLKIGEGGV